jgi:gluconate kinase
VTSDETRVLFLGGRSGVGKSTVAFELSRQLEAVGVAHALIEGDNLDQAFPQPWRNGTPMAERNLAAMWGNYRDAGYTRLIYTNTVSVLQIDELVAAIGGTVRPTGVLLLASDATAEARLSRRESGVGLKEHVERSRTADSRLRSTAPKRVHRLTTDGLSATEVATAVLDVTGWAQ